MIAERILKSKSVISFKDNEKEVTNMRKLMWKSPVKGLNENTLKILWDSQEEIKLKSWNKWDMSKFPPLWKSMDTRKPG